MQVLEVQVLMEVLEEEAEEGEGLVPLQVLIQQEIMVEMAHQEATEAEEGVEVLLLEVGKAEIVEAEALAALD